jgi:sulfur-carrier protein
MTIVHVPSPLHSYTKGRSDVDASGATLGELLADLDRRYPGFRHRIVDEKDRVRPTILFYVGTEVARDLAHPVGPGKDLHIIAALRGG